MNRAGDNPAGLKIRVSPRSCANWTERPIGPSERALNACQCHPYDPYRFIYLVNVFTYLDRNENFHRSHDIDILVTDIGDSAAREWVVLSASLQHQELVLEVESAKGLRCREYIVPTLINAVEDTCPSQYHYFQSVTFYIASKKF